MKRITPLQTLIVGLAVGLSVGAGITVAHTQAIRFNYDQVVGQAGETAVTRAQLAEAAIARSGGDAMRVLNEQAIIDEAVRRAGVTVSEEEIQARLEMAAKHADFALMRQQFDSYPRHVLRDRYRSIMLVEKAMKLTLSEDEARAYYNDNKTFFHRKAAAKLTYIAVDTRDKARQMIARLRDGESARKLSATYSTNETIKAASGESPYVTSDMLRARSVLMAEAVFDANSGNGLRKGQYTDIIEFTVAKPTPEERKQGLVDVKEYWIAFVDDMMPAYLPKYEQVKDIAIFEARSAKLAKAMPIWIDQQSQQIPWKQITDYGKPDAALVDIPYIPKKFTP